jgi:hypothetical protein
MAGLKQPWLGVVASASMIMAASLVILPWDFSTFTGVVANYLMCTISFAGIVGGFWRGAEPRAIASLSQPLRGLAFLGLTAVVGAVVYAIFGATIGGGLGDTPFLAFGIIVSIVVTFTMVIMWGGWPFTLITNRLLAGAALLVASSVITGLILRSFNYAFLAQDPSFAALDPAGPIPAWDGLVIAVTFLATLFLFLHFDLWPLSRFPAIMSQPVLGAVWTVVAGTLATAIYFFATRVLLLSPDAFLATVPVPFLFGSMVLLTMLGGSATSRLSGVGKGVVSAVLAAIIGSVLAQGYRLLMPMLTRDAVAVTSGSPMAANLWLASALLAITFPLFAIYHDFFDLWPLRTTVTEPAALVALDEAS